MKKILLLMSLILIISCNEEIIEDQQTNIEEVTLRAGSVPALDRSNTIPLWEYVSNAPTSHGYKDYYYKTGNNLPGSITVNSRTYTRVRQIGRIFANPLASPYNTPQGSAALTLWYSPSRQRHTLEKGFGQAYWPDFRTTTPDYVQVGILGYMVDYVSYAHRSEYVKEGMLEWQAVHMYFEHADTNKNTIRLGTNEWFIQNFGVCDNVNPCWSYVKSLGYIYCY